MTIAIPNHVEKWGEPINEVVLSIVDAIFCIQLLNFVEFVIVLSFSNGRSITQDQSELDLVCVI